MGYALVTGGSRGIGRAVCVKLAQMGYKIVINYVSNDEEAEKTLQMVREAGSDGELLKFDVSDNAATVAAIETWQESHSGDFVEVLVNNAGIRKDNLMLWMEPADWDKVLGIGLHSFYNVTRPLLQPMLVKKRGRIINMASLSGMKGLPGQCNYSASKGGLIAAT
ncbi:MAG: SDR family NAD(P)-dependent oxidoreductase, partial [Prevotella sp.]|nr:SDR family NAD(P)-dependent oxidoreductase [Prevotella sp.]